MHLSTLAAFVTTLAVAVPAGWHLVDADFRVDGTHVRPLQQTVVIDGVTVSLDVDHSLVSTGDKVVATLVATADEPRTITVELATYIQDEIPDSRVSPPPRAIDREKLVLHAAPDGGAPVKSQLVLGSRSDAPGQEQSFRILASAPGVTIADDQGGAEVVEHGDAAVVGVLAWSGNKFGLEVAADAPIVAGQPFVIAVHAKNTTRAPMQHVNVRLATAVSTWGYLDTGGEAGFTVERIDPDPATEPDAAIAPGAEEIVRFTVTPPDGAAETASQITFIASAYNTDHIGMGFARDGAMDAHTFDIAAAPAPAVAGK